MPNDGSDLDLDPPQPPALSDSQSQRLIHDIPFPGSQQPPIDFWENRLESPARRLFEDASDPPFLDTWIKQRKPRQLAMLCRLLGVSVEEPARQKRARLKELHGQLIKFVPASDFALWKSMHAALDVAAECLDAEEIAVARESNGKYDTTALIFAILHRSWMDLEKVFHLDKPHKVGFARMRLPKPPRRPERKFKDFLASSELSTLLKDFDAEQRDRHTSELLQVIELPGAQLVFIRRPHQKSHILAEDRVVHGFTADQIVLDFRDAGTRLNVASHDQAASYDIANRIASTFYGRQCEYENITEETYPAQIQRFLQLLRDDRAPGLTLVEMRIEKSPLDGAPHLDLSAQDEVSLAAR